MQAVRDRRVLIGKGQKKEGREWRRNSEEREWKDKGMKTKEKVQAIRDRCGLIGKGQ